MTSAALNGLGRFGQHLLHAWLKDPGAVTIDYAADAGLDAEMVCTLLTEHDRLDFSHAAPSAESDCLCLTRADGVRQRIAFHHGPAPLAPWLGFPAMWLECSGLHPAASDCRRFLAGNTKRVLVGATCWDADQTLVMGFNHESLSPDSRIISYGSCTVNAFVPLANWLHERYGVLEAQVHVIHNVPTHDLADHPHPERRNCTLQGMAPRLLPWLAAERLFVSYTLIPYSGASLIDFSFRLRKTVSRAEFISAFAADCTRQSLKDRYAVLAADPGVSGTVGLPFNAVLPENGIRFEAPNLHLSGYFDNENSATRYLEFVQWVATTCRDLSAHANTQQA